MKIKPVLVFPTKWVHLVVMLMHFIGLSRTSNNENYIGNLFDSLNHQNRSSINLPVLHDSTSVDAEMQNDLMKAVLLALEGVGKNDIRPVFMDIAEVHSLKRFMAMEKAVKILFDKKMTVAVSLVDSDELSKFANMYDRLSNRRRKTDGLEKLYIYSPRTFSGKFPASVIVKSLQMSEAARALALLERVRNVGVKTLIPILDDDSPSQFESLQMYSRLGKEGRNKMVLQFTKPILLNNPVHTKKLKMILLEHSGFHTHHLTENPDFEEWLNSTNKLRPGVLLLAKKGSHQAMKIAAKKNHLLLSWFSPNIMEIEEWAHRPTALSRDDYDRQKVSQMDDFEVVHNNNTEQHSNSSKGTAANNNLFGLYSVNFIGSKGWDNPNRRRMLGELATFSGATPRILSAVLAVDAAMLARDHLKNGLHMPKFGLSGEIAFNENGFRKKGTFMGASSVPNAASFEVALLQPSTWILEDFISVTETDAVASPKITDYDVATSSILTKDELVYIANSTRNSIGCSEHAMNIITYDPFNQMPYHYFFNEANIPETIMVPNHQGFGITFVCSHYKDVTVEQKTGQIGYESTSTISTLQVACTPGNRMSHPVNCFRSHVNRQHKRAAPGSEEKVASVPSVQYQYSLSGNDPWLSQNSQWASSKGDAQSQYFYQPNRDNQVESVTYGYLTTRLDVPIAEEPSTTPAPSGSKLPELRQILKAMKPFVGSCIGSSTGCAICVLVLGRLPLGNNPTACTGPCFVGTFGSCGALLGRVFAETTVICTELFRQGLLDVETFVADAEFGRQLAEMSPYTMEGYKFLATPLVDVMRSSKLVTDIVAMFAIPWANHMKYLLGRSEETNLLGNAVHLVGYPICNIVGRLCTIFNSIKHLVTYSIIITTPFLTSILTLVLCIFSCTNLGCSKSNKRFTLCQLFLSLRTLPDVVRETASKFHLYFKAIGRST